VLTQAESAPINHHGVMPSVALSWHPDAGRLLFLRYGSASRQGGSRIDSQNHLDLLDNDSLKSVEAGWRQAIGHGQLELGAWHGWWHDVQSDMLRRNGLIEMREAGNARIMGAEAGFQMPLGERWQVDGGVNVTSARLVDNELDVELSSLRLPVVPDYVARAGVSRSLQVAGGEASVALRLRYVGPARLSFDPQVDRPIGAHLEARVESLFHVGRFEITASIDNLFGETDTLFAFGNSLRFAAMRQYVPMAPRTITMALTRRFCGSLCSSG
jgi:outer membrane receptor protein involved in Fe transport